MKPIAKLALAVLLPAVLSAHGAAQNPLPRGAEHVRFEQKLGDSLPLDAKFTDASGREIRLRDAIGSKPTILVFVYYECPMLCTQVLNGLTRCLRAVPLDVGRDFRIVTLSFDPGEKTELAATKKDAYVSFYGREGAASGWTFLTGREQEIVKVTDAAGFGYQYNPETDQYAHASGIVIVTPDGTIARYFYGIEFAPRDVKLGLVEASQGHVGNVVDQFLLLCLHYDPSTGKYSLAIMTIVRLLGGLTVAGLALLIFVLVRRGKKASKLAVAHPDSAER